MGPQLYLMLALALSGPATYGVMWVKRERAVVAAYNKGVTAGKEQAAAAVTQSSRETVSQVDAGERSAQPAPADLKKRQELCNRMASCRDRKQGGT